MLGVLLAKACALGCGEETPAALPNGEGAGPDGSGPLGGEPAEEAGPGNEDPSEGGSKPADPSSNAPSGRDPSRGTGGESGSTVGGNAAPPNRAATSPATAAGRPVPSGGVANGSPNWLFDEGALRTYELTLDPAVWQSLQRTAREERYAEANLAVEGMLVTRVGLRFKGSLGTLTSCVAEDGTRTCAKLSMKVKFNEYVPDQEFSGIKRLNFNSMVWDPSLMRERLAYHLFRESGVAAPRAVHALLVVNGESLGLFTLVEDVDGRFTDDRFAGGDGNLYKEAWPDSGDVALLDERLETNEEAAHHTLLLRFYEELRAAPAGGLSSVVARYMDFDALSRFMAVDRTITDWDGPTAFYCYEGACENHNYFLYQHENEPRFTLIPWDLDNTFEQTTPLDGVPGVFQIPQNCGMAYDVFGKRVMPPACDRLFQGFARGDRRAYVVALESFLAGPFTLDRLENRLATWQGQIEDAVAEDRAGPGRSQFQQGLDHLRSNLAALRERALADLASQR